MLKIRQATKDDIETLCDLGTKTFRETYEEANTKEDMDKYVADAFNENAVKNELSDAGSTFFITSIDGKDVGYSKVGTGKIPDQLKGKKVIELERMYALKDYIGAGIGKEMMKKCLEFAGSEGYEIIWVRVWGDMFDKNLKAIGFYKKWGFEPFGKEFFMLGNSKQEDILMKRSVD